MNTSIMDTNQGTTTRLRRTFAYPTDEDDLLSTNPDALDEQEQEDLIASLATENENRNAQFAHGLLALPAVATLPYLVVLCVRFSSLSDRLIAMLSLSSLGSTAYMLYTLAPGVTGIWHVDAWTAGVYPAKKKPADGKGNSDEQYSATFDDSDTTMPEPSFSSPSQSTNLSPDYSAMGALGSAARRKRRRSSASSFAVWFPAQRTPLELYLPYLNLGLCVVLMLMSVAKGFSAANASRESGNGGGLGEFGLGNLPAIVYAVVLVAKVVMGSVDPEKELTALRYQYLGA